MKVAITKGLGISLAVVFIVVALLIFGQMSTGSGSFWYGLNNPNTSALNISTGQALGQGTISTPVSLIEATALPILLSIGIAAGMVLAVLKAMGVF